MASPDGQLIARHRRENGGAQKKTYRGLHPAGDFDDRTQVIRGPPGIRERHGKGVGAPLHHQRSIPIADSYEPMAAADVHAPGIEGPSQIILLHHPPGAVGREVKPEVIAPPLDGVHHLTV